ncbi:hypothetical protein DFS34DRAFT_247858 [Phlyctochytrium arcticum]|nr:hypothetical protein DFS34DRAFT_247858 [Phlyctochytrium arcticum]
MLSVATTIRSTNGLRTQPVRLVNSFRTKFEKPPTHVILLQDVRGLGQKGEITLVDVKKARNYLVPFKMAYYVPRIRGKPVLPEGWEPRVREEEIVLETITPAFPPVSAKLT